MDGARLVSALVLVTWCVAAAGRAASADHVDPAVVRRLAQALGFPVEGVAGHRLRPPPPYMLDLYNSVADVRGRQRGHVPYGASVVRSYLETDPASESVLRFVVPVPLSDEKLLEAELHVHVSHVPHTRPAVREARVQQVTPSGARRDVDSRLVSSAGGWHVFHVRAAVDGWPQSQLSLDLQLLEETSGGEPRKLAVSRRGHHHNKQPLLVLFSRDNATAHHRTVNEELARQFGRAPQTRSRRSAPETPAGCERRHLYVDFQKIGWSDVILAPAGYDAYHCLGECRFPLGHEQRPSNHATVQSLVNHMGLSDQVAPPSCVPSSLSSLHVLFTDGDTNVVLKHYMDMVAEECGCH